MFFHSIPFKCTHLSKLFKAYLSLSHKRNHNLWIELFHCSWRNQLSCISLCRTRDNSHHAYCYTFRCTASRKPGCPEHPSPSPAYLSCHSCPSSEYPRSRHYTFLSAVLEHILVSMQPTWWVQNRQNWHRDILADAHSPWTMASYGIGWRRWRGMWAGIGKIWWISDLIRTTRTNTGKVSWFVWFWWPLEF